jgi:hypothetical protein
MTTLIAFLAGCLTIGGLGIIAIAVASAFIDKVHASMRSEKR